MHPRILGISIACLISLSACHGPKPPAPASGDENENKAQDADRCHSKDKIVTCLKGVCDPASGDCVECLTSRDCNDAEKPVCSEKTCVPCDEAHACDEGRCEVSSGKCVECLVNDDCALRERGVCWQGVCSACDATNCPETCHALTGKCGPAVVFPCPGEGCGTPSPMQFGMIDPRTAALGNLVDIVIVRVQDRHVDEKPIEIGTYKVDARVNGMYANVTTEFTVYNPNDRVFEGELAFPLPDDAVVSGYAIDVNGVLVEGQVVEKEKARIAFEAEVKKGIDPGLVEQVKGNMYRTRIYPISAHGTRQIRVVYTTPLTIAPNGDAALALPMPKTKLARRDIAISVASSMPAPAVGGLGDKRFESAEAVWRVESHDTDITPTENILVAMPNLPDVVTGLEVNGGDIFFSASVKTADIQPASSLNMPDKWRIVWDASGSRSPSDVAAARRLIDALPENATYELHIFRHVLEPPKTFRARQELAAHLDRLAYDGGTDFGPLEAIASQPFDGPTLFFTDGMDTMNGALPEFGPSAMAILSGAARDLSSMRRICGGRTLNLDIVNGEEGVRQILASLPVVSALNGEGLRDIQGIGLLAAGRVTVVGRMRDFIPQAEMLLSDGRRIPLRWDAHPVPNGNTIATAWAARRVDELSPRAEDNREELLAIGRRFSVVSPVSSMIVFERLEQWLEYDIEPPSSLTAMHAQWLDRRPSQAQRKAETRHQQEAWMGRLSAEWNNRVAWWNNPVPKISLMDRLERRMEGLENGRMMGMAVEERAMMDIEEEPAEDAAMYGAGGFGAGGIASETRHAGASITVKAWDPDTPYLQAIKDAYAIYKTPESLYDAYLRQRAQYAQSPAFFLDCASLFFRENQPVLAVRILSNLSELKINDVGMLRIYAWRLREAGAYDAAIMILRKVARLRPDEAISWRDLALTLTMRGKQRHDAADIQEALELFHKTAFTAWKRDDALWTALIALEELNELVAWTKRETWDGDAPRIPAFDSRYAKNLDTDLRIMMTWDADNTDIDMHVVEPSGEEVFYGNNRSRTGSLVSHDVTTGYGPEEFLHKRAPKGKYTVSTKYFASHQQSLVGPATVTVTFYTNWGRPTQQSETMSLRLDKAKDKIIVGEYTVK